MGVLLRVISGKECSDWLSGKAGFMLHELDSHLFYGGISCVDCGS